MGKSKTQRTEALHQAARRYVLAKQAQQAIEQHNFDRLIRSGLITGWIEAEPKGGLQERQNPPMGRHRL